MLGTLMSEPLDEAVDLLCRPRPAGTFLEPFAAPVADEKRFESSRCARWFGR
jgi:hypothetical protein